MAAIAQETADLDIDGLASAVWNADFEAIERAAKDLATLARARGDGELALCAGFALDKAGHVGPGWIHAIRYLIQQGAGAAPPKNQP